jgi:hypothetical protein
MLTGTAAQHRQSDACEDDGDDLVMPRQCDDAEHPVIRVKTGARERREAQTRLGTAPDSSAEVAARLQLETRPFRSPPRPSSKSLSLDPACSLPSFYGARFSVEAN